MFYQKYPHGLMTPTHRPETGCRACRKARFCIEHDHLVTREMLLTLHDDMIQLMPRCEDFERLLVMVPLPPTASYEERYLWLLELLHRIKIERQKPKGIWSAVLERTHRVVS